jgi:cysteine-S-conjugate beta-lyase
MPKYNFDEQIDRKNTCSLKYDFHIDRNKPEDLFPLWVADMDFKLPIEITQPMIDRCYHGIFGYTEPQNSYFDSVKSWYREIHKLELKDEWIKVAPGIVFTINALIRGLTKEGDGVLVQQPVYYPFFKSIENNKRKVVNNSLIYSEGKYEIDFEDFEEKIREENVKLFILCSPHNPVGRVWTREELKKMGDICKRYGVIVISDEAHSDFAYKRAHLPFWNVDESYRDFSIVCTSPGKTFNQAGLQNANIFIANPELKKLVNRENEISGYSNLNVFGLIACESAYKNGYEWYSELKEYLKENIEFARQYISENLPKVKLVEPEATYLLWLDFKEYDLSQEELDDIIVEKSRLWLNSGTIFGTEGEGFQRINIATTKANLQYALERIKQGLEE